MTQTIHDERTPFDLDTTWMFTDIVSVTFSHGFIVCAYERIASKSLQNTLNNLVSVTVERALLESWRYSEILFSTDHSCDHSDYI